MSEPDLGPADLEPSLNAIRAYGSVREDLGRLEGRADAEAAAQVKLDGLQAEFDAYRASHPDQPEPAARKVVIGMSAPPGKWAVRLAEVGADGIKARRIFCKGPGTSPAQDNTTVIRDAVAAGMLPVVSYKLPGPYNHTALTSGAYDSWARQAGDYLASLGREVAVTVWHEPYGDMSGPQFVAMQARLLPLIKGGRSSIKVGPILNGWLLTATAAKQADFRTYLAANTVALYDFVGIDTYHDPNSPTIYPGHRIDPLVSLLSTTYGRADMPLLVGEFNTLDAAAMTASMDKFLSTPTLWAACVWNDDLSYATVLAGDRLAAFKASKNDQRAVR